MRYIWTFSILLLLAGSCGGCVSAAASASSTLPSIVFSNNGSFGEVFAARELRRFEYLRTGQLAALAPIASVAPASGNLIVVGLKSRPFIASLASGAGFSAEVEGLKPQQYLLRTITQNGRTIGLIAGGDTAGVLYGAYRFAEHLGIGFYLSEETVPDALTSQSLPVLNESGRPLFDLRGIQPFHDFPEGPDWWSTDDYKSIISQLPKMRMNFIGLHTYPEGRPNAEPTVWIGQPADRGSDTKPAFSYPSSYFNTWRGNWGYARKNTGAFSFGAASLFDRDDYGSDVMAGQCPQPTQAEGSNLVFERTGQMLREASRHAHALGVKTCVGTENPLTIPSLVKSRLQSQGKSLNDPAVLASVYEGIFRRIQQTYGIDYYWTWTPEVWYLSLPAMQTDLTAILQGLQAAGNPFELGLCGWGSLAAKFTRLDPLLPKSVAFSCINDGVGNEPVDTEFWYVNGRPKWAIPWLEDDPGLTSPQLWAKRIRADAADALRYGCTGLMGIHWRTRILSPNVSALAQAAWEQSWNPSTATLPSSPAVSGPVGGQMASYANTISGTTEPTIYQTVRWDLSAYRLAVPNGTYSVTLKFAEVFYSGTNQRVFDVAVQGQKVLENLDVVARVGKNVALDYTYNNISVTDGWLVIDFYQKKDYPAIAGLVVDGPSYHLKVDCGSTKAYADYSADWSAYHPKPGRVKHPVTAFYQDWALRQFGPEASQQIAQVFEQVDGALPRTTGWLNGGPGGLSPDGNAWANVAPKYAYVQTLEYLRPMVKGAGNLDRLDYWLNTFRYQRAAAQTRCIWAQYNSAMTSVNRQTDPQVKKQMAIDNALPLRKQLVQAVAEVYRFLLAAVNNSSDLGTVANWEEHILPGLLETPGTDLANIIGPLPADAMPETTFQGQARLIVPTVRTSVAPDESLSLRAIVLDKTLPQSITLYWRPMGEGAFSTVQFAHVARGVYSAQVHAPGLQNTAIEYYVQAKPGTGAILRFPTTAPTICQTVTVEPATAPTAAHVPWQDLDF